MKRMTIDEIAKQKKCSVSTIQRLFKNYLNNPPVPKVKENNNCHLIIDGTYHSDFCLINYFDADLKHIQYYEIIKDENYRDFESGLKLLKAAGIIIASITSDGHRQLIMAVKEVFPGMTHQRCIVHVQRMALNYLTKFPKSDAGKKLRIIVKDLHKINTHEERKNWIDRFRHWEFEHHEFIHERKKEYASNSWHAHPEIRKVRSVVNNALPNLFYYLDDKQIPKSTNGLECRFSYLKNNLRIHRGLSKKNRRNFVLWYNFFKYN